MDYAAAKEIQSKLDARVSQASDALNTLPKLGNGLTPDAVKLSPEYRTAKQDFDAAFSALRAFNAKYTVAFRKELRADRLARRAVA
jgi:hypothetical protein